MLRRILATAALAALLSAPALAQTYTTFTVPGSTGTIATAINNDGTVAGYYTDDANTWHGFVRGADGTIATFDPEGSTHTSPVAIDRNGTVAGTFIDANGDYHGFLRDIGGTITAFEAKNANGTFVVALHGKTVGYFSVGEKKNFGFARSRGGHIEKFRYLNKQTYPTAINGLDQITGEYRSQDLMYSGFLRAADGSFTSFDVPGATTTIPSGIARDGTITGFYTNGIAHGFVRTPDGSISTFDVPDTESTKPIAIDDSGTVLGTDIDTNGVYHGFLRAVDGTLTVFDVPDSTGTDPIAVNNHGVAVGFFSSASGGGAFIRAP
jgi:uncharacterized membrane protein